MYTLIFPHSWHMPRPSSRLFHHQKILDQYKSWSLSLCNSLQSPIISPLSCSSSALHSQNALNLCSSLNVKFQWYILITITITKSTCININYDISCVFYMILCHTEGGWSKAKTNICPAPLRRHDARVPVDVGSGHRPHTSSHLPNWHMDPRPFLKAEYTFTQAHPIFGKHGSSGVPGTVIPWFCCLHVQQIERK